MRQVLTRRNVLIGLAAAGATGVGGATWIATADVKAELLEFFKHALPGVAIDEKSARACIDEFTAQWSGLKTRFIATVWRTAGVETTAGLNRRFEGLSRQALTSFLVNSNFFQAADPRAELIVYVSRPPGTACASNPFANLDPP